MTIDKELAEEKAENLEQQLEQLKQQFEIKGMEVSKMSKKEGDEEIKQEELIQVRFFSPITCLRNSHLIIINII